MACDQIANLLLFEKSQLCTNKRQEEANTKFDILNSSVVHTDDSTR